MKGAERKRGWRGWIDLGELELKLSPAVDTVSGEILFFSERRQMFGYQVRNRSLFSLFFFSIEDGRWSNQSFSRSRGIFLFCCLVFFSGGGDLKKVSDFLHVYTRVFYGNSVFSYWEKRKVGLSLKSFRI